MSVLHLRKSDYYCLSPDDAEGAIGGSIMSDLLEDTDFFLEIPDDYAFSWYLSKEGIVNNDIYARGSCSETVIALYREGRSGERAFLTHPRNDNYTWKETTVVWSVQK